MQFEDLLLVPLPGEQSVDAQLVNTIENNDMTFFDFRGLASRTNGHYPDGYHMDSAAADIYSRAIAEAFAQRFRSMFTTTKSRMPSMENKGALLESHGRTPSLP